MSIKIKFESEEIADSNQQFKLEFTDIDDLPCKLGESEQLINSYLTDLLKKESKELPAKPIKKVKEDDA